MLARRQLVFGLGTGRCGTRTLAFLLDAQPDSRVVHERRACALTWHGGERTVDGTLAWCRDREKATLVGDVGFYYLPYVPYILERQPDARFVCLQRDRADTVNSYLTKTVGSNHWMLHDGTRWRRDPWDACYPQYEAPTKREALERYWDDYYRTARALEDRHPGALRVFPIETLNTEAGQREILDFVGVPAGEQHLQPDLVLNKSTVVATRPTAERATPATGTPVARDRIGAVTAIVKTFDRPRCLDRLIRSIRRHYPALEILVADDGFNPCPREDVGYVRLAPDVGVSRGRNLLLERVTTPYFLLLDDDWEFFADTRIERLADVVASGNVSLAAGEVFSCRWKKRRRLRLRPLSVRHTPFHGLIRLDGDRLTLTPGYVAEEDGYFVCDLAHNFFVARVDDVRAMGGWDDDLKLNEHWDFFLRFKRAGFRVAHCPDVRIRNWDDADADPPDYRTFRRRDYTGLACHKHGIRVLRDLGGSTKFFGPSGSA